MEIVPEVDREAVERERVRVAANRAAAMLRLERERAKLVVLQQLPRSVAVVKIPSGLEGWKDARAVARATMEFVGATTVRAPTTRCTPCGRAAVTGLAWCKLYGCARTSHRAAATGAARSQARSWRSTWARRVRGRGSS